MKIIFAFVLFAFVYTNIQAQVWYFGQNAGVSFSNNSLPASIGGSAMNTGEGCAVACDSKGQLLFYTDGTTVWGRNHVPVQNGLNLMGSSSSTQSVLILPIPKTNCQQFFIFTTAGAEDNNFATKSIRYSIIDFSNSLFPNGEILAKNVSMPGFNGPACEKLASYYDHAGGYWLLAHGYSQNPTIHSRSFYSYNITSSVIPSPIVSTIGSSHNDVNNTAANGASQGQMKFSETGQKLALASTYSRFVEILDFDLSTGILSNPITINQYSNATDANNRQHGTTYGVEFSGNFLYTTETFNYFSNQVTLHIYQFDITTNITSATLWASRRLISASNTNYDYGALQRGPGGNIYLARNGQPFISWIVNSNTNIAALSVTNIPLGSGAVCKLGLPQVSLLNFSCRANNTCCPELENMVGYYDFEYDRDDPLGFTTQYTRPAFSPTPTLMPGEFMIADPSLSKSICSFWPNITDHSTCNSTGLGSFMIVNGFTGKTGSKKIIWEQTINNVEGGKEYKFCAQFKNLPQCCFDIKPKIDIKFISSGLTGADLLNQTINANPSSNCGWVEISKSISPPNSGNFTIQIWLDESPNGDGNDLAIDDIAFVKLPQINIASTVFSVSQPTPQGGNNFGFTFTATPLPSGCKCAWAVCEVDPATNQCKPLTTVYNDPSWWTTFPNYCNSFNFAGYNGTSTLGSLSAPGSFDMNKTYRITRGAWCDCKSYASTSYDLFRKNNLFYLVDTSTKKTIQTFK